MIVDAIRARTTAEQRRFIKFCVVGGSGVVVNLAFVWVGLLIATSWDPEGALWQRNAFASALGILVSVFGNFLLNDLWTWGDRTKGQRRGDFINRTLSYYLVSLAGIAIQYGVAMGLSVWLGWVIYLAQAVGILLATGVNYVANNRWTFADQEAGGTSADGEATGSASNSASSSASP
ncbi:MAG: GtrA family protein [Myxococcota bacterium]|nr:GtrA family protein [Myxococcota bacterium]